MANSERDFVTKAELLEAKFDVKEEISKDVKEVDAKVDSLSQVVLPLVESSKQTASNTDRIANTMDEFTKEQRRTNGDFYDRLHVHEKSLGELGVRHELSTSDKKELVKIIVAGIGFIGVVVSGIFGLAPLLFG